MWSWHPLLMSSRRRFCAPNRDFAKRYSAGDGDNKEFVAGESTKEAVKTIAQGMPGVPVTCGHPVYIFVHGCGCTAHPAFPCALIVSRAAVAGKTPGARRRGKSFAV